jgi:hypothetical protein
LKNEKPLAPKNRTSGACFLFFGKESLFHRGRSQATESGQRALCGEKPERLDSRLWDASPSTIVGLALNEQSSPKMHFTFALADKVDPIAIYAAFVATLVFVWNVHVWLSNGPRLKVTASMNMLVIGGLTTEQQRQKFLIVGVTNVGSKQTTITNVLIHSYESAWRLFRRRPNWTAVFNNVGGVQPIPYVLDVGHNFSSKADQSLLVEKIRDTYFYAGVQHSFSQKPVMVRVKYSDPKD